MIDIVSSSFLGEPKLLLFTIRNRNGSITRLQVCFRSCLVRQYHHYPVPTDVILFLKTSGKGRFPNLPQQPILMFNNTCCQGCWSSEPGQSIFTCFYVLVFCLFPFPLLVFILFPHSFAFFFSINFACRKFLKILQIKMEF